MRLHRDKHVAGKFEAIQKLEIAEILRQNLKDRFFQGLYLHLLNHHCNPKTYRFVRVFNKAFKRP